MANHVTVYGMFRSRSLLEKTIEVLREEGFRSPDLSVVVGTTRDHSFLTSESGGFVPSLRPSWIVGTVAFPLLGHTRVSTKEDLFTRKQIPQFVARGGLLLSVDTQDQECAEVAIGVFEDAGAIHFVATSEVPRPQSVVNISSDAPAHV